MAVARGRVLQLWLLLQSTFLCLVQAQFDFSATCDTTCYEPAISQPYVNGDYYICTVAGLDDFRSCVCRTCDQVDVTEANRLVQGACRSVGPPRFTCPSSPPRSGGGSSSSSTSSTRASSPTSATTRASSLTTSSTASPTAGGGSSAGGSSSGSSSGSSRRKGSGSGVKAGIGVGVVAGIFVILGLIYFVVGRWKFIKLQKEKAAQNASGETGDGIAPQQPSPFYKPELDNSEKSTIVSDLTAVSTGHQGQAGGAPYHAEMPTSQPSIPVQPVQPVQGGAGPRWGEVPTTHNGGPVPYR